MNYSEMTRQEIADHIEGLREQQEKARVSRNALDHARISVRLHNANVALVKRTRAKYNEKEELAAIAEIYERDYGTEHERCGHEKMNPCDFEGYYDDYIHSFPNAYTRKLVAEQAAWDLSLI